MNTVTKPVRSKKSERGAELVEFAFILPVLLVTIAGIWDFGRAFRTHQAITNAAREGARFAVLPEGKNQETAIQNRVKTYLTRSGIDTAFINSGNIGTYIEVRTPLNNPADTTLTVTPPGGIAQVVRVSRVLVHYPFRFLVFGPVIRLWVPASNLGGDLVLQTAVTMENQT